MKNDSEVTNTFSLFILSEAKLGNYVIENGIKVYNNFVKEIQITHQEEREYGTFQIGKTIPQELINKLSKFLKEKK